MRILFLIACMLTGIFAGLWWTGLPPTGAAPQRSPDSAVSQVSQPTPKLQPGSAPALATQNIDTEAKLFELNSTRPFSYHDGITRVAPSVVSVYASEPLPGSTNLPASQGSGVIVDADGIVLTNLHLIENFNAVSVVLSDGRNYPAVLIGSDTETDLAVVKIEASMLPVTKLDEAAPLKVGDIVLAIGNPFGVGQTVTQGIVSATRRRIANGTIWQNFIQIDAAINPGNSGGALINPLGQLVGINTAVFRADSGAVGIGFAIPADLLSQVVPQIIENGSVSRGWLGLGVEDLNMYPALKAITQHGAVITSVQKDGPADLRGVRPMDIVVQLGEQPIINATQLLLAVSALPPGATVKLALLRSPNKRLLNEGVNTEQLMQLVYKVKLGTRPYIDPSTLDQDE